MREKRFFVLYVLSVFIFCAPLCPILAKAPDTPKIVFAAWRDGNHRDIYLMNPDGSEQVNITNHRADDVSPIWSPTGEHILFVSDRDGPRDLYLMNPDGANVRRVFGKSARRGGPTWGPDEKQIVYNHGPPGNSFIYIGTIDGKKEERMAIGGQPTWSPDGTQIVFRSGALNKPRRFSLLYVKTNRQTFFPFPKEPMWVRGPAWSPSGDKLAFSWHIDGFREEAIYVVNRDGTDPQEIVGSLTTRATDPIWSPDGTELLHTQLINRELHIFKVALDGGKPVQLTHEGWNYMGDWFDPAYALPVSPQPQLLTTQWGDVKKGN
jgi:Tol biopolymer transport system component